MEEDADMRMAIDETGRHELAGAMADPGPLVGNRELSMELLTQSYRTSVAIMLIMFTFRLLSVGLSADACERARQNTQLAIDRRTERKGPRLHGRGLSRLLRPLSGKTQPPAAFGQERTFAAAAECVHAERAT